MKMWKYAMVLAALFFMLNSTGVFAVEEDPGADIEPTFQNAAQAQRAENLAGYSYTQEDMDAAKQQAADAAEARIDEIASDYAYLQVKQISRDYAITQAEVEDDFPNLDARATYYADKYVEEKAAEYAISVAADENSSKYKEAYEYAVARATDPSYHNVWDTAYMEAIEKALDDDFNNFNEWRTNYDAAYARATAGGDDWEDAWHTAYYYASARATNPDYPNAYQAEYKKALEAYVAGFNDDKRREIYEMRFEQKLGWGVITKKLGLEAYHNGLGNTWRHRGSIIDNVEIPSGPEEEEMSLKEELSQATQRNLKTGWERGRIGAGQKKGNSKKYVGLTQTSVAAGSVISETIGGKGNNSRGKGGSASAAGKSKKSDNGSSNLSSSRNSPGKAKGNSKNSNVGSSKSDRGNSGKDSSKNSNAGGNGKGKGNGKK